MSNNNLARTIAPVAKQSFSYVTSLNWKVIAWTCLTLPPVGLLYWMVHAQGLREKMPILGMKLYKVPLPIFSYLREYEGLHSLDLAHVLAVLLLFFVYYYWTLLVRVALYGDDHNDARLNKENYRKFLITIAVVLLGGDCLIFYTGLASTASGSAWGGEQAIFVPIVGSLVYVSLTVAIAVVHVRLSDAHQHAT